MGEATPELLFLLSSGSELMGENGTAIPTGVGAAEVLVPYRRLKEAGYVVRVATPDGAPARLAPNSQDPGLNLPLEDLGFLRTVLGSLAPNVEDVRVTLADLTSPAFGASRRVRDALMDAGQTPQAARDTVVEGVRVARAEQRDFADALQSIGADRSLVDAAIVATGQASAAVADELVAAFAADPALASPESLASLDGAAEGLTGLVVPGGTAGLDLASHDQVGSLIATMHGKGALIATLGHGAAALLSTGGDAEGRWLFDGYRMVAPSADEDSQLPDGAHLPWVLANALMNAGAVYDDTSSWSSHVSVDRNLVTAQNQYSTEAFADAVLAGLALGVHLEGVSA